MSSRADKYITFSQREQIRHRPETYVGSPEPEPKSVPLYNFETGTLEYGEVSISDAEMRIFIEVLSNAVDNALLYPVEDNYIKITMSADRVVVQNGGHTVPVEYNVKHKMWVPVQIFGTLNSSSNYDDEKERKGGGRNGLGVKLTSIFSTSLTARGVDTVTGEYWEVNTKNAMESVEFEHFPAGQIGVDPTVGWTEVAYSPDFSAFHRQEHYHLEEHYRLYAALAMAASLSARVPVYFVMQDADGETELDLTCTDISLFASKCFPTGFRFYHYEWPADAAPVKNADGTQYDPEGRLPLLEAVIIDTPGRSESFSYVNGVNTFKGGVHVTSVLKSFSDGIIAVLKEERAKERRGKSSETEKRFPLDLGDVRKHVSVVVNCYVDKPKFEGQQKHELKAPPVKCTLPKDFAQSKAIRKWDIFGQLKVELSAKKMFKAAKGDRKRKRDIGKAIPANKAGTKESEKCTLFIVEGDSAKTYIVTALGMMPNGNDYYGVLPFRGKPINAIKAKLEDLIDNKEYEYLKNCLGLQDLAGNQFIDYEDPVNFAKLKYGRVCIVADADQDGKHINGLTLAMFYQRFPSLLKIGYVFQMPTPVVRANGTKFYTDNDFKAWMKKQPKGKQITAEYYKGLGSSSKDNIADDFKQPKYCQFIYDQNAADYFRLAFANDTADDRKLWIASYVQKCVNVTRPQKTISSFINDELIEFAIYSLGRAIPSMIDGLKISQRKIVYTALHKFGKKNKEMVVAQFGSTTSNFTHYHHGPDAMNDTVMRMAQWFVGSNNMPYFSAHGQVGSRLGMGADAPAARYPKIKMMGWVPYVFRPEDSPILEHTYDEGEKCECVHFYPLIPMHLVNGCEGMAVGNSTFIPAYKPEDLIEYLLHRIELERSGLGKDEEARKENLPEMVPWYRGFTGEVKIHETFNKNPLTGEYEEVKKRTLTTQGKFEVTPNGDVKVTELPVGKAIYNYLDNFIKKVVDGEVPETEAEIVAAGKDPVHYVPPLHFKKYSSKLTDNSCVFTLSGVTGKPNLANLRLTKSNGLTNMVLLDKIGRPRKFEDVYEIMETFFEIRLEAYDERRKYMATKIDEDIKTLQDKLKFAELVCNGTIRIGASRTETSNMLVVHSLPEHVTKIANSKLSPEGCAHFEEKISAKEAEKELLLQTSSLDMYSNELNELKDYITKFKWPQ